MHRSISKLYDEYQELTSQAKHPAEYIVLKHDLNEVPSLPVDPNLLILQDALMREKYFKTLYVNPTSLSISKEFSYNLLTFYLFLSVILLINLLLSIILYQSSNISSSFFLFHIVCTGSILTFAYIFLFLLLNYYKTILINRTIFLLLGLSTYIYLILGSSQVFSEISNDSLTAHLFPTLAELIAFTYSYRRILFDSYRYLLLTLVPVLILFLSLNLIYSDFNVFATLAEFATLVVFALTQIVETNSVETRTIQLFYRMQTEESAVAENFAKPEKKDSKESMLDTLESKCDFVLKEIKYATSVIIFRDVKTRLKSAQAELVKIKNKLPTLGFNPDYELVTNDLDAEDKEFILQNYLKISTFIVRPNSRNRTQNVNTHLPFNKSLILVIEDYLAKLGTEWNINPFYIQEQTGKTFSVISTYIFKILHLESTLRISEDFFANPYHNSVHAADVCASLYYFYQNSEILHYASALDTTCVLISALGHDVGHPGVTNRFLVSSRDPIAIQYNDNSVLENMHCSIIFSLMANENLDILSELSQEDWTNCRKMIICMVLDTDLSKHFEICARFKSKALTGVEVLMSNLEDKIIVFAMALKCSDIGHSAKCKDLHLKWTQLVLEEFFQQGDVEKGLGLQVSMYCDRNSTDVPKSQAGFIKNICIPLYENWCLFLKSQLVDKCLKQLRENFEYWDQNYKNGKWTSVEKIEIG